MSIQKLLKDAEFDPGITGVQTHFGFVKAELDKDFIWSLLLKFDYLPPKISMNYTLHFYLDPEPTQDALRGVVARLQEKQLELGVDIKEKEDQAKEQILSLKAKYDKESNEIGVYSFDVEVMEFKNKAGGKEIKFLSSLGTIKKLQDLNRDMHLERMVVALDVKNEDDELKF